MVTKCYNATGTGTGGGGYTVTTTRLTTGPRHTAIPLKPAAVVDDGSPSPSAKLLTTPVKKDGGATVDRRTAVECSVVNQQPGSACEDGQVLTPDGGDGLTGGLQVVLLDDGMASCSSSRLGSLDMTE